MVYYPALLPVSQAECRSWCPAAPVMQGVRVSRYAEWLQRWHAAGDPHWCCAGTRAACRKQKFGTSAYSPITGCNSSTPACRFQPATQTPISTVLSLCCKYSSPLYKRLREPFGHLDVVIKSKYGNISKEAMEAAVKMYHEVQIGCDY